MVDVVDTELRDAIAASLAAPYDRGARRRLLRLLDDRMVDAATRARARRQAAVVERRRGWGGTLR